MNNRHDDLLNNNELLALINAVVEAEIRKDTNEMDTDLIKECVDLLMELNNLEPLTAQQLAQAQDALIKIADKKCTPKLTLRKRKGLKAASIAACCALLILLANFVAMAFGVDTIAILKDFGDRIVEMFVGEEAEYKGITIIRNGSDLIYDTTEEFLLDQKLNVLYPTVYPEGTELKHIMMLDAIESDGIINSEEYEIVFATNLPEVSFYIFTSPNTDKAFLTDSTFTRKVINGYSCYISQDNTPQYNFVNGKYTYTITAQTHQDAILIINNLKECKINE